MLTEMDLAAEKALLERAKHDPAAFGTLYEAYFPRIYGYVLRRTADVALAQDITSEVFYKALKHIQGFQWRGIPFSAWLYRVAGHEVANSFQRDGYARKLAQALADPTGFAADDAEAEAVRAEQALAQQQEFLALHAALKRLPPRYQEVLALRFFEKKPLLEVAAILGKKEGTVKSLLHRGLEKLRVLMADATFARGDGSV